MNPQQAPGAHALAILRDSLAELYESHTDARRLAQEAGIDTALVSFDGKIRNTWHSILVEATHQDRLCMLLGIARTEYPHQPAVRAYHKLYCSGGI